MDDQMFSKRSPFEEFIEGSTFPVDIPYDDFQKFVTEINNVIALHIDYFDVVALERELSFISEENPLKNVILGLIDKYALSLERENRQGTYLDVSTLIWRANWILEEQLFRPDVRDENFYEFRNATRKTLESVTNPYVRELLLADVESEDGCLVSFLRDELKLFRPDLFDDEETESNRVEISVEQEKFVDEFILENIVEFFGPDTKAGKALNIFIALVTKFQNLDITEEELDEWFDSRKSKLSNTNRLSKFNPKELSVLVEIGKVLRNGVKRLDLKFINKFDEQESTDFYNIYAYFSEAIISYLIKRFEDGLDGVKISNLVATNMIKGVFFAPSEFFTRNIIAEEPIRHMIQNMYNGLIDLEK